VSAPEVHGTYPVPEEIRALGERYADIMVPRKPGEPEPEIRFSDCEAAPVPHITVHYPMGRERTLAYHAAVSADLEDALGGPESMWELIVHMQDRVNAMLAEREAALGPYRRTVYAVEHPEEPAGYRLLADEPWCPPAVREAQEEAAERITGWRWRSP
jgi:hypothetical protein